MEQRVDVVSLVRAVKCARTDVHDAEARRAAVVSRENRARAGGMQTRLGEARRTHLDLVSTSDCAAASSSPRRDI